MAFNARELRIDTFRSGIRNPVTVRVTHIKTGMYVVVAAMSEREARKAAEEELARRVWCARSITLTEAD